MNEGSGDSRRMTMIGIVAVITLIIAALVVGYYISTDETVRMETPHPAGDTLPAPPAETVSPDPAAPSAGDAGAASAAAP